MIKFDEVKSKVEFVQKYLKGKSPETLFGSNRHKFELSPCLSDNEISEFETKHNIVLPAQYRRFISEIGNGGMGPGLGVIALGFQNYRENPDPLYYPEYLSVPFQYTETWNYDFETFDFENEADEEYEYRLAGSIPIALYGCTHECQLVITGEEAGNIWWDERGTDYGILPHTDSNGNHIDFITWYDSWLDEIIIKARKSNLIPEDSSSPKPRTNHYLLKIIEITDKNTWNNELAKLPYAHVLQTWEWGQFKYETTGWIPHRWAFKHDDEIVAMCSMGERKAGLFSVMYAPKGPAMDYSDLPLVEEILHLLQNKAKQHHAIWLKIDPDLPYATGVPGEADDITVEPGNTIKNMLEKNSWTFSDDQIQFRNTVTIDLTQPEDDILMAMSGNTRRKVRQAEKKGVTIREASIDDMDTLYALYDITGDRNAFLIRPQDYYLKLWHYFMENDLAHALIAEYEGTAIAQVILFHFGETCWYFYGASSNTERNRMPNYALQWSAMKWAKNRGYKTYDMWGAPNEFNEEDSMWGVFMFKQGFRGTVERRLGAWDTAPIGLGYKLYTEAVPRVREWIRTLRS